MKMKLGLAVVLLFAASLFTGMATMGQTHQHSQTQVTDGAKSPELIPDSVAYLHVLLNLSLPRTPTSEEVGLQKAILDGLSLTPTDRLNLMVIATNFRTSHAAWQERWNTLAKYGGSAFSPSLLIQQREDLILGAHADLKKSLSQDGFLRLDGYVQRRKRGIQIHAGGQQ